MKLQWLPQRNDNLIQDSGGLSNYDLKQECAAIEGFKYQHPSETETPSQTLRRRRKLHRDVKKISEASKERQETTRFQRAEHNWEHACKNKNVQYVGPGDL
jgi:hypothetical protein